jgi:VCBS repeat protein
VRAAVVSLSCVLLLLLVAVAPAAPEPALVTTVQTSTDQRVETAILADVNGDGRRDLLVGVRAKGRSFDRALQTHLRRDDRVCFPVEPDAVMAFDKDDIAYAAADIGPAPGDEVLFFGAREVFAGRAVSTADEPLWPVVASELLWQLPHPREVYAVGDLVRDLNGDGLMDLLLPGPEGYGVALQQKGPDGARSFGEVRTLSLADRRATPGAVSKEGRKMEVRERLRDLRQRVTLGEDVRFGEGALLSVLDAVPYPILVDYDGDGRPDLLALLEKELRVWLQGPGGVFAREADRRLTFPVTIDAGRRLDLSFGSCAGDLNGDARTDCIILAGDRRARDIRTQILVYLQKGGELFGEKGRPDQVLLVKGFAGNATLTDVDGDGDLDLSFRAFDVDTLDTLRAATGGTLDISLRVHLNEKGRLSAQPDLALPVSVPARSLRSSDKRIISRFIPDVTGDRRPDLLLRHDPEEISVFAVRRTAAGLMVQKKPTFEMRVHEDATVEVAAGDAGPELLILESKQVHHVRFKR